MTDKPPTPQNTINKAREIALSEGINYCYTGNVYDPDGQTTYCPTCKSKLIERDWHSVNSIKIVKGKCPNCKEDIPGVFD